jgi:pimeloyl-ACP methyl ester carboxylesterase
MVGELDIPDFSSISDQLARRIPNARQVVLSGVGHMSNMENPPHFNLVLEGFLRDLE